MKTSNYLIALATLTSFTLVGCSDNDFLGTGSGSELTQGNGEISFSSRNAKYTRATGSEAARLLNSNFIVWGEKDADTDGTAVADGKLAFKNYLVEYAEGTAGYTESNTNGWEYVGKTPYDVAKVSPMATEQTIKYWDFSASNYVFNAFSALPADISGGNIVAEKTLSGTKKYDKGYVLTLNGTASLGDLYFANREVINTKDNTVVNGTPNSTHNVEGGVVYLTFRSAAAKVRYGFYETIPGYSVTFNKFYYAKSAATQAGSAVNFGINGDYVLAGDGTKLTVTYAPEGGAAVGTVTLPENTPIVTVSNPAKLEYFETENTALLESTKPVLGVTSPTAVYDKNDKEYTAILPNPDNSTDLVLKVDYTLTSTDGSGETIYVTGATAHVPAAFAQWQSNFAYTYIFKISDNTNGSTGSGTNPVGLYPITFDACVVDAQVGDQQTITTIANPSITTYQDGSNVVENDEYTTAPTTNTIYITVDQDGLKDLTDKYKLFTAFDLGQDAEHITEATVANYINNDIALTDITDQTSQLNADKEKMSGRSKEFAAGQFVKFTPTDNNIYVFQYEAQAAVDPAPAVYAYKVIKVVNGSAVHTYTISGTKTTVNGGASVDLTVKEGLKLVTGLQNYFNVSNFKVEETGEGVYTFTALAGATTGNVTIKGASLTADFNLTVNSYSIADVSVPAGLTKKVDLNLNGTKDASAAGTVRIKDGTGTGLTVSLSDGVITVTATADATDGIVEYVVGGNVVATANVSVVKPTITASASCINGNDATSTITIANTAADESQLYSKDITVSASAGVVNGSATKITTRSDANTATLTAGDNSGIVTLSWNGASTTVEVTHFAIGIYTAIDCGTAATGSLTKNTDYYVKFTSDGTPAWASLVATGATITRTAETGIYKLHTPSTDGTGIKVAYNYKGVNDYVKATATTAAP